MTIFVAPHHDDVLLSLPAELLERRRTERHVLVCFSEEEPRLEEVCTRLHQELGLTVHALGFQEAMRRGASLRSCLRAGRTMAEVRDDPIVHALRGVLGRRLQELGASEAWVPLLPVHLDHALVRSAVEGLASVRIAYYEDQPYATLFQDCARRERQGLVPLRESSVASVEGVAQLLRSLEAFVSSRGVDRLVQRYVLGGTPEPLWQPLRSVS